MIGLKCGNPKCGKFIPADGREMFFKWKDNKKMVQVHVCPTCWARARSLKCER